MTDAPLPPGSTIGILGGGQLGRMMSAAASRLGLKTHIYNDTPDAPAFHVAAKTSVGAYDDLDAIAHFAGQVDVVTCEFENVPAAALEAAGAAAPVFPPVKSFEVAQERLAEKDFISGLGIAVAPYAGIDTLSDLKEATLRIQPPALLKTRRFGYDGKGQARIHTLCDAESAWESIGEAPAILEGLVDFERELSVVTVRGRDGAVRFYDVVENVHKDGILHTSTVPARIPPALEKEAKEIAGKIAEALGHVGIITVEMFQRGGAAPALAVNEIAPRVHNSGHWTQDACLVSQFENHVRAICGWPLGDVTRHSDAVMTNLIGSDAEGWRHYAAEPSTAVHLYGKAEARPGRKMGHINKISPKT
ncbi:MAG: 5-(carboxyamino)imidazole ribonucleotide synthase [Methyloceanibacter sp.]|nr:5-(carboxyamino)imidazole ribonucleotide synthase [Methyloceanibacter sp.]